LARGRKKSAEEKFNIKEGNVVRSLSITDIKKKYKGRDVDWN
jgi:hypothetical protein